ncbi:MAG: hypothetical protein ACPGUV_02695 [Polyangiales bacterium]
MSQPPYAFTPVNGELSPARPTKPWPQMAAALARVCRAAVARQRHTVAGIMLLCLTVSSACQDTGQTRLTVALQVAGTAARPVVQGPWQLQLTEATVALGPMYFCATVAADSDLCRAAQLELPQAVTLNALDAAPMDAGSLQGVSGTVQSTLFDYGFAWLLTTPRPIAVPGAETGRSAVMAADVTDGTRSFRVRALVDVLPLVAGSFAVRGARTTHTLVDSGDTLQVRLDPQLWWQGVDIAALAALDEAVVELTPDSTAYNALVIGMTSTALPSFTWSR